MDKACTGVTNDLLSLRSSPADSSWFAKWILPPNTQVSRTHTCLVSLQSHWCLIASILPNLYMLGASQACSWCPSHLPTFSPSPTLHSSCRLTASTLTSSAWTLSRTQIHELSRLLDIYPQMTSLARPRPNYWFSSQIPSQLQSWHHHLPSCLGPNLDVILDI